MKRLQWILPRLIERLRQGKYRTIVRVLVQSRYRRDVLFLHRILFANEWKERVVRTQVGSIVPSHQINYPGWVLDLYASLRRNDTLAPIKIIRNPRGPGFMVADGNHRLMAQQLFRSPTEEIECVLLEPLTERESGKESHGF